MAKVMISLPGAMLRIVDRIAKQEGRNRSELIREALRSQYFERDRSSVRPERARKAYQWIVANPIPRGKMSSVDLIRKMRDERWAK